MKTEFVHPTGDRGANGRESLRATDPRMAALIDADPRLDPDALFDYARAYLM